jgi:hypothetical protein
MRSLLLALVLSLIAIPVCAQGAAPDATDPVSVLNWVASGLGAGAVIAFLFQKMTWFKNLDSQTKYWTILILSIALPVLAETALQLTPPDLWTAIQPYWAALAQGFLLWAGSQAVYQFGIKPRREYDEIGDLLVEGPSIYAGDGDGGL